MTVVTRFAPSPTGSLHLGGARTALFNWLYARHFNGKFLLRIEDTDRERSTAGAVQAIYDGINWLGLNWDGDAVSQFSRANEHRKTVQKLLASGNAYKCYCTPQELAEMRDSARADGRPVKYDGRWREKTDADKPNGIPPVIRLKTTQEGETIINDIVQGVIKVRNEQIDDMVLMRADGTPTYMLAVVVDDHDMGVTHIIRGDDHLTNSFRQYQLYDALGWKIPKFAHIPLIHGSDGAKLSKRHGAVGIDSFRDDGFLPETMRNYLLRLGWAHGDEEIISTKQAIKWFNLGSVGKSPSRFDIGKLKNLNAHYMRVADKKMLFSLMKTELSKKLERDLNKKEETRIFQGMDELKERAKTVLELSNSAFFYIAPRPLEMSEKAAKLLNVDGIMYISMIYKKLTKLTNWTGRELEITLNELAKSQNAKLGQFAQPLRAALTGSNVSPGIFIVMEILGQSETLGRLNDVLD